MAGEGSGQAGLGDIGEQMQIAQAPVLGESDIFGGPRAKYEKRQNGPVSEAGHRKL